MNFPEQLDNRSFRLLVQRTITRQKTNQPLSSIEKQLAALVQDYADLGFDDVSKIDVDQLFENDETNPFLTLSSMWEISKQIQSDVPKGMQKIVKDAFGTNKLRQHELLKLSENYLDLYRQVMENESSISDKEYLWEMFYALNRKEEHDHHVKDLEENERTEPIPPGLVGEAFEAIARELHEDAGLMRLAPDMTAREIYMQLPLEWVTAMAAYWERPQQKLKRDQVNDLLKYFQSDAMNEAQKLSNSEKNCLRFILDQDNIVSHASLINDYGPEDRDGFWWTLQKPKSVLGLLRMKGLVVVGEMKIKDEMQRVAVIPRDIVWVVRSMVKI